MTRIRRVGLVATLLAAACAVPPTGPIALDDMASVESGGAVLLPVLLNDRAPVGETLTITGVVGSAGSVRSVSDGQLAYTAAEGFSGDDRFTYSVVSDSGLGASATVVVSVKDALSTTTESPSDGGGIGPTIEVFEVTPALASTADTIAISVSASDADSAALSITIAVEGRIVRECDASVCSVVVGPMPPGEKSVDVAAVDESGNVAADQRTFVIDGTPPVVEGIAVEPSIPHSAELLDVVVHANDDIGVDKIEVALDNNPRGACAVSPCRISGIGPFRPGVYVIEVVVSDLVGNSETGVFEFEVVEALPDLVVESFELLSAATEQPDGFLLVPARLVVANVGAGEASAFDFSLRGRFALPVVLAGALDFNHRIPGLRPGESLQLDIEVRYNSPQREPDMLVVSLDSCAGVEFPPIGCDVRESNEDNNTSDQRAVDFPPSAVITRPRTTADLVLVFGQPITAFLDGTQSYDPDGSDLSYRWMVERTNDGSVRDISSAAADEPTFDLPFSCSSTNYRFTLTVMDETGNSAAESVDIEYSHIC